jgi:signal transduction histidine kinase
MKLAVRCALGFFLIFALLFGSAWLVLDRSVRAEFRRVEIAQHEQDTRRVLASIAARSRDLTSRVVDYASWNDTRQFLLGAKPDFPTENFTDDWFTDYDVGLVLFADSEGKILWGRNRIGENGAFEASKFLFNVVLSDARAAAPGITHVVTGVAWTQHGPMLYAARPASTSLGKGPPVGLVVIGQYLSSAMLREQTQLDLDFINIAASAVGPNVRDALDRVASEAVAQIDLPEAKHPESLIALRAANGRAVGAIRAYHSETLATLGERSISAALTLLGVVSGALLIGLWLFLHTSVTGPLANFERHLKRRGDGLAEFEGAASRDEIGSLVAAYNALVRRTRQAIEHEAHAILEGEAHAKANQIKTDFIANISHELRTPLTAIMGYCELVKEDVRAAGMDQSERDVRRIDAAAGQLLGLINEVLDMSKIESGQIDIVAAPCDVLTLVNEAVDNVTSLAAKNDDRITIEAAKGIGVAHTDGARLRQCLTNLLENACKFTRGGNVTVRASRFVRSGHDWLRLEVEDNGIGMTAPQMARLFEPFTQANPSIATQFGGAGLGLTITRRLLGLMGGSVSVESAPGAGAVFTILLPAALPAAQQAREAA